MKRLTLVFHMRWWSPCSSYILCLLHQTTTACGRAFIPPALYILCLLHQTTTSCREPWQRPRCISYVFYIKPQLVRGWSAPCHRCISYVFYIKPQHAAGVDGVVDVVYLMSSTSNHNLPILLSVSSTVVYLMSSTSNHNWTDGLTWQRKLYILCLLHQTTTGRVKSVSCC